MKVRKKVKGTRGTGKGARGKGNQSEGRGTMDDRCGHCKVVD